MAPWTRIDASTWTRPFGEHELFIKMLGDAGKALQKEHWGVTASVRVARDAGGVMESSSEQFAQLLRKAWAHLRFQHPNIAAEASDDGKTIVYHIPTKEDLQLWLQESFIVVQDSMSAAEINAAIMPAPFAILRYIVVTQEIMIQISHWRTDGLGVFLLLDAFLEFAATLPLSDNPENLAWGDEVHHLGPCVEDIMNMPDKPSASQKQLAKDLLSTFSLAKGASGISYLGDASTPPGGTGVAELQLDKDLTAKVVAACKSLGVSVTSAVHASLAIANWDMAKKSYSATPKRYASTARFALRPHAPPPYNTPASAAILLTAGWMVEATSDRTWEDLTKQMDQVYKRGLPSEYLKTQREYIKQLSSVLSKTLSTLDPDPPSDIDISSIGIIDEGDHRLMRSTFGKGDRSIALEHTRVGVQITSRQGTFFVYTFRGKLNFSLSYNQAYHSEDQMERFVKTVRDLLLRRLEIE